MADSKFYGVIPPVVVPLDANRELDVPAFERSINRMIEGGVHGLFFLGSSGEVAFLNDDQRFQLLEEAVRLLDPIELTAPVHIGDVVIANILNTGIDIVATANRPALS